MPNRSKIDSSHWWHRWTQAGAVELPPPKRYFSISLQLGKNAGAIRRDSDELAKFFDNAARLFTASLKTYIASCKDATAAIRKFKPSTNMQFMEWPEHVRLIMPEGGMAELPSHRIKPGVHSTHDAGTEPCCPLCQMEAAAAAKKETPT